MMRVKKKSIVSPICNTFHAHINPLTQIALNYPSSHILPLCLLLDSLIYDLPHHTPLFASFLSLH